MTLFILLTVFIYVVAWAFNRRFPHILTLPVITASAMMIIILQLLDINYENYRRAGSFFTYMLGPGIVAFAIPLYRVRQRVLQFLPLIFIGVVIGLLTSLISTYICVKFLPLSEEVAKALVAKNITLPIAISIAESAHISVPLTSVTVVLSGCFGFALGQKILTWMQIKNPIARGTAIAATSHIMGTSAIMLASEDEGAVALVTMASSAVLASFIFPIVITSLF